MKNEENKKKSDKSKHHNNVDDNLENENHDNFDNNVEDEIPPSIIRRRQENTYRYSNNNQTFDIVMIVIAVFIAFFMVKTNGCSNGLKNFAKMMTSGKNSEYTDINNIKNIDIKNSKNKNSRLNNNSNIKNSKNKNSRLKIKQDKN